MPSITPTTTPTSTLLLYATNPGTLKAALTAPALPGEQPTLPDDATLAAALTSVLAELDRRIPIP